MPEQRVSDEYLSRVIQEHAGVMPMHLAFDLLDARALLAAVRPVVAAAVAVREKARWASDDYASVHRPSEAHAMFAVGSPLYDMAGAVDALPADVREWAREDQ